MHFNIVNSLSLPTSKNNYDFCFSSNLPPIDRRNNMLSVSVHVDSHNNLSISCTFLSSFHGVLHCEIWHSNTDSTLARLKFSTVSQQRASAGDSVSIDSITLDPSTVYFYNVSAVPDGESTPAVVVQGVITTPPTTTPSTSKIHGSKLALTMSKTPHSFKKKSITQVERMLRKTIRMLAYAHCV